uniref:RBOHD n=1 Tax=Arundo donax TaxID=35708 RepID=A0A0A9FWK7_ARUDO
MNGTLFPLHQPQETIILVFTSAQGVIGLQGLGLSSPRHAALPLMEKVDS